MKICIALLVTLLAVWVHAQHSTPAQDLPTRHSTRNSGLQTSTSQTTEIRRLRQSGISTTETTADSKKTPLGRITMRTPRRRQTEKDADSHTTESGTKRLTGSTSKLSSNDRQRRSPDDDDDDQTPQPSMDGMGRFVANQQTPDDSSSGESEPGRFQRSSDDKSEDGKGGEGGKADDEQKKEKETDKKESEEKGDHPSDGKYKRRRQVTRPLTAAQQEQNPTTVHDNSGRPITRIPRQQALAAAPAPAAVPVPAPVPVPETGAPGKPVQSASDLSQRGHPRPPTRPLSPPPPPSQGGSQLTLPDGYQTIINPVNPGFSCDGKIYGYYADTFNDCKVFHVCVPIVNERGDSTNIQWSFICGNQTLFNQEKLICDHQDRVDCNRAQDYYDVNNNFGQTDNPRGLGSAPGGK